MARIAFFAPMKPPDHPTPSGDREIARLFLRALEAAGHEPVLASRLRLREAQGDPAAQAALRAVARAEARDLLGAMRAAPPALWFTYHCYWKAPDLLGPAIADALAIPYVVAEPSRSAARSTGPWAGFAADAEAALIRAERLIWTKPRDLPALETIARPGQLAHLPPFVDPGPEPGTPPPSDRLRLLAVAMMRPGDKLASFRALAEALSWLTGPWSLSVVGDGAERGRVEALMAPYPQVVFEGAVTDASRLRALYEAHDLLVWPGRGEGIGLTYLEAQAAGLPALAEAHPGPAAVLPGALPAPGDPRGFAAAIAARARRPGARAEARAFVLARHGIDAAARRLGAILAPLLPGGAA